MRSKLRVNEIFCSIQGEGANAGMLAVFIRLAGCNLKCPFCDTRHEDYREMTVAEIITEIKGYKCNTVIWTGGEPSLQLTDEILINFMPAFNCIETNGSNPVSGLIDYVACSPKVGTELLNRNFKRVNEFRYPVKAGDTLPDISLLPAADDYFVSPIDVSRENVDYCLKLIKENPVWRLSVQIHKLLNIP
ncbi:MAG: 7-carboxy-7-deazaguanine synthase QueE [Tannerella sp.]|jgi:organic radical activating enzyme|nr:7-carboxy-7-deazaguanine synthase QueE [Tannerella sp.]